MILRRSTFFWPLIAALLLVSAAISAHTHAASEPASVIIIFDGSGSMWGQMQGERQSKLSQARSALAQALSQSTPLVKLNVGLYSYGNLRRRDCNDASALRKLAPFDIPRIMRPLRKLNPKGRGPLTHALRRAANELANVTGPASIILIHDGLDNCRGNPCAFAQDFSRTRPGTPVHVVSIGLRPDAAQSMSCLAKQTGGKHFDVQSRDDIRAAMTQAWQLAMLPSRPADNNQITQNDAAPTPNEPPPPAPLPAAGFAGAGLYLTYALGPDAAPLQRPAQWRISPENASPDTQAEPVQSAHLARPLSPGNYRVELSYRDLTTRQIITVRPDAVTRAKISLNAGALTLRANTNNNNTRSPLDKVVFSIFKPGQQANQSDAKLVRIVRSPVEPFLIRAGEYIVKARYARSELMQPLSIAAGQTAAPDFKFNIGHLHLNASINARATIAKDSLFIVYEDNPEAADGRLEITRSAGPQARFTLPAGAYTVLTKIGNATTQTRLTVKSGTTTKRRIVMQLARLQLSIKLGDSTIDPLVPVRYKLVSLDQENTAPIVTQRLAPRLTLDAGRYRIESKVGLANALLAYEIVMRPGQEGKLAMKHQAGQVSFRLLSKSGQAVRDALFWHIADAKGQSVMQTVRPLPHDVLTAGRYTAIVMWRGKKYERQFEVTAGDEITVDLKVN